MSWKKFMPHRPEQDTNLSWFWLQSKRLNAELCPNQKSEPEIFHNGAFHCRTHIHRYQWHITFLAVPCRHSLIINKSQISNGLSFSKVKYSHTLVSDWEQCEITHVSLSCRLSKTRYIKIMIWIINMNQKRIYWL